MSCSRCSGFMVEELMLDIEADFGEMWARSSRCVNCGHVHDAVIKRNRLALREKGLAISSIELDYLNEEIPLRVESFLRNAA